MVDGMSEKVTKMCPYCKIKMENTCDDFVDGRHIISDECSQCGYEIIEKGPRYDFEPIEAE